jgi:spore maturation protein CgeB
VRVGVIGPVAPDYFADNVCDALRGMGHDVMALGSAGVHVQGKLKTRLTASTRQAFPGLDERVQRRIARSALDTDCEVVINLDSRLMPNVVRELKRNGARVAFWFPDAMTSLGRSLMLLAPYDALFLKEPHLVERLRATLDLPTHYLPEACNPRWHTPLVPPGSEPYLVLAGNMYPSRVRLLERLMAKSIPVQLYGPGFPRWIGNTPVRSAHTGKCIFREEKARIFRAASGVLNTLHPAEVHGVNARLFEGAGSGAAVLTEYRPTIPELFAPHEILTFRDFDELVDQANRLLGEAGLTAKLGDAAAQRAHRDHTYERRLTTILERVS